MTSQPDLYGVDRHDSPARFLLSRAQRLVAVLAVGAALAGSVLDPRTTLVVFAVTGTLIYLSVSGFKAWLITAAYRRARRVGTPPPPPRLAEADLPTYTVLVPMYREGNVVTRLVSHLSRLDYPQDRHEILLLIEEDDEDTLSALRGTPLPPQFEVVLCPPGEPRTKPRACNVGLAQATGELCVIYDAEDRPALDQLRLAAETFASSDERVICLQGRLDYHNHRHNWLTRFFTVEYNHWFDLLLPALAEKCLPIPLGGTSNHFQVWALRDLHGWDPYNVTEDADLGVRIFAAGGRTAMLDSVTLEEACSQPVAWTKQRTRWIKGYLQTWAVHSRRGSTVRREGGWRGVVAMHLLLGGTPLVNALNPLFWAVCLLFAATRAGWVIGLFPGPVLYVAAASLVIGNFCFCYLNLIAVVNRERWHLVHAALFTPFYWLLMSVATLRAISQLVTGLHTWEKTPHGLSGGDTDPAGQELGLLAPVDKRVLVGQR